MPSGPAHDRDRFHLFIVCTEPVGELLEQLVVGVTSLKDGYPHDPSCYLYVGDHSFISRKSWVFYRAAKIVPGDKLAIGVADGQFLQREILDQDVFDRVCHGIITSDETRQRIRTFYCNNS